MKIEKRVQERLENLRERVDNLSIEDMQDTDLMIAWLENLSEDLEKIEETLES